VEDIYMPVIPNPELIEAIENATASSGHTAVLTSPENQQPFHFSVSGQGLGVMSLWLYVKALTFAHRRDPDEYRIQLKSADLPLALNPAGPTLLFGYYPNDDLFVGFNPTTISATTRTWVTGGYVSLRVVQRAQQDGMTFDRDNRGRIAVGLRPDMLVPYALTAAEIHATADDPEVFPLLRAAAAAYRDPDRSADSLENDIADLPPQRARLLRQVRTYSRDSGFRDRVVRAYNHRCAVTGTQLGLVDAAHILPVSAPGSTDRVTNGIALLANYHRAFDSGLIYLTEEYVMRINPAKVEELETSGLDSGLREFRATLGEIHRPSARRNWPDPTMIRQGNVIRKIRVD
jgi:putative restriction endonuclease